MKFSKISLYIAAVLSITGASCSDSYLDKEVDLTLQPEFVFSDFNMTRGVYANIYTYLPDAFAGYSDTQFRLSQDCLTDNSIDYWGVARYHSVMDSRIFGSKRPRVRIPALRPCGVSLWDLNFPRRTLRIFYAQK